MFCGMDKFRDFEDCYVRTINLVSQLHAGQVDKGGTPYICHLIYVSSQVDDYESKIVALLHDSLEDTTMTVERLTSYGYSNKIVKAVVAITKHKGQDYKKYINSVAENDIAILVKMHDLKHNLDESRLGGNIKMSKSLRARYDWALRFLCEEYSKKF